LSLAESWLPTDCWGREEEIWKFFQSGNNGNDGHSSAAPEQNTVRAFCPRLSKLKRATRTHPYTQFSPPMESRFFGRAPSMGRAEELEAVLP
jgi:hypothetical protein